MQPNVKLLVHMVLMLIYTTLTLIGHLINATLTIPTIKWYFFFWVWKRKGFMMNVDDTRFKRLIDILKRGLKA